MDLGQVANNLFSPMEGFNTFVSDMSFILAIAFLLGAFVQFRIHKLRPAQAPLSTPIFLLIGSLILFLLPLSNFLVVPKNIAMPLPLLSVNTVTTAPIHENVSAATSMETEQKTEVPSNATESVPLQEKQDKVNAPALPEKNAEAQNSAVQTEANKPVAPSTSPPTNASSEAGAKVEEKIKEAYQALKQFEEKMVEPKATSASTP